MKIEELEVFDPFLDLDEKSKLIVAKLISTEIVNKSEKLFDIGDDDTTEFFLVSGEIELLASDGIKKKIRSGDPVARFPLALLRPRKFSAHVISPKATLIKIDVEVLRNLKKSVPVAGDAFSSYSDVGDFNYVSSDVDMDDVKQFLVSASKSIAENRLTIGNFDTVSNTIFNVVNDPELSLDVLASAIQLDPAISAKIIKSANSAFFGGLEKVDTVRFALVRLGLDLSVQLVTVMVMKEVFHSSKDSLQMAMTNVWKSSIKLATYSVVVGKKSKCKFQQGQTLLAGLMSEIGALVIIAYLDQYPSYMQTLSDEILSSNRIKRKLAKDLLIQWVFPEAIVNVIDQSDDYERVADTANLSDVVLLARLLVRMAAYRKLPVDDISSLPAYQRLGFDPDDSTLVENMAEEAERYAVLFSGVTD